MSQYSLFLKDKLYPWDTSIRNLGLYHIVDDIETFKGYVKTFGIPKSISLHGKYALDAAKWLLDTCRDIGAKFPSYMGSVECMSYLETERIKGHIYQ